MERRDFGKMIALTGASLMLKNSMAESLSDSVTSISLPKPVKGTHSVEICLNSRFSSHGSMAGALDNQILSNVLWAASKTPLLAQTRTIYAAIDENVYLYDSAAHLLKLHVQGKNSLSEPGKMAFEIGISTTPEDVPEDAGAALHWAQLASVAFWGSTGSKPVACCPRDSGSSNANNEWKPLSKVHLANCYGSGSTASFKTEIVAKSSDKSLSDPLTDGKIILEDAITAPLYGSVFDTADLSEQQISQIVWAAYGATPHTIGSKACVTVASHGASFFLQGKIFIVTSKGVQRFSSRGTSGSESSKDHRVESVTTADKRGDLRDACSRISSMAPVYIVICAEKSGRPQLLDAGFSGASALIQATALGLQGHYCASLSAKERSSIQSALGITAQYNPLLVFAAGKPATVGVIKSKNSQYVNFDASPNPFDGEICISVIGLSGPAELSIYDISGRKIRGFKDLVPLHNSGVVRWDGCDDNGVRVQSGTYICKLTSESTTRSILLHRK